MIEEKKLPEGWERTNLGEVAKWSSGGTPKRGNKEYYGGNVPWVKTGDLNYGVINAPSEYITEIGLKNSSAKLFPKGAILIAMYGATIGKTAVLGIEASTNQACAAAIANSTIESSFLHYFLKSQKQNFIDLGKGGAQPNISQTVIKSYPINLPPLPVQKRIVSKLDILFGHLEVMKEKLAGIPKLIEEFRQSVLTQAVTGKLTEEWRVGKLGEIGKWSGGGTPSKSNKKYWEDGTVPWITPKDMKLTFLDSSKDKMTVDAIKNSSAKLIDSNSILIVTRSGILRRILPVSMNMVETTVNQDLKAITLYEDYSPKFILFSLIGLESKIRLECMKSGTTVESVDTEMLKGFELKIPNLEKQEQVVKKIESLFAKADAMEVRYEALKGMIDDLPQAVLGKAFRGELV